MRIALAHDWLAGRRGGEAVLDCIAALVLSRHEPAGLYAMFDDGRPVGDAVEEVRARFGVTASFLNGLPRAARLRRWMLPLYPAAVGELSCRLARAQRPIDLLISTSSAAIKAMRAPRGVPHLCYCHSPARYLWSADGYEGGLRGAGLRAAGPMLRAWDRRTARRVTRFVANSSAVRQRIRECYGREASIVPPPVRTDYFTPGDTGRDGSWLLVGALEPYKRVDLAIRAAAEAGAELRIVGTGSEESRLRALAGPSVVFEGRLGDEALRERYRTASLLLMPQIEDFGIVAVEAQACGLPVVARRAGGALDSVVEGVTGAFFDQPVPGAVVEACRGRPPAAAAACRENALRFSESAFRAAMIKEIDAAMAAGGP
ncbi:MAG: glycosyltransferase [Phycisphaerales bacterium]|nr:glycosyltransferase [Phycisphaerales bacterium]